MKYLNLQTIILLMLERERVYFRASKLFSMNTSKKIHTIVGAALCTLAASAQHGLVGFANYSDLGLQGTTGGTGGQIVHVTTRDDFERYASASAPYIIILDADLKGHYDYSTEPKQKHDVITVKSDKTIIGGGSGARLDSLGLDIKDSHNIIIRNLKISKADPDAIAFRNTHHVWVDHCDLSSQKAENDANDGLLDFTNGSTYMTVSWCKLHDHDKTSICCSGTRNIDDVGKQRVTYHHNAFINCTQRNPRIGYGLGHIFNDYNETNTLYGIGFFARAIVNVENCYFKNVRDPFCQMYSAGCGEEDAYWGFVMSEGNKFESCNGNCQGNSDGFDTGRYYTYDFALDAAADVPGLVAQMGCIDGLESDIIPFPGDGAIGVTAGTHLACGDIEGAQSYSFTIGMSPDALRDYDPATFTLQPATAYYWQVKVNGGKYDGKTSPVFRFSTASASASFPAPDNGETAAQLREIKSAAAPCVPMYLRWRQAFDAIAYTVYISTDPSLSEAESATVTSTQWQPATLRLGNTYYWRVDATASDGSTIMGETWKFASPISYAHVGHNEVENAVRGALCFPEYEAPGGWITASNNWCNVGDQGPGYMSFVWDGDAGSYDLTSAYFDEKSGQAWFGLFINEERADQWTANKDNYQMEKRTTKAVQLIPGDEIRLEFYTHNTMRCRTDYIDISVDEAGIQDILAIDPASSETIIYDLMGRRVTNPRPGIYIVNGKKTFITK